MWVYVLLPTARRLPAAAAKPAGNCEQQRNADELFILRSIRCLRLAPVCEHPRRKIKLSNCNFASMLIHMYVYIFIIYITLDGNNPP